MTAQRYDLLIGTQIVAKGHHFPMLTLVGVVDADLGLAGGDLRAAERTYQLLHQVGGRAGRAERPGRRAGPDLYARAAGDAGARRRRPRPVSRSRGGGAARRRSAAIRPARGADRQRGRTPRRPISPRARWPAPRRNLPGVEVLGPAPAPLAVLRGRHRRRFLVKAGRDVNLQAVLRDWLGRVRFAGAARLQVDIDPYSFL